MEEGYKPKRSAVTVHGAALALLAFQTLGQLRPSGHAFLRGTDPLLIRNHLL